MSSTQGRVIPSCKFFIAMNSKMQKRAKLVLLWIKRIVLTFTEHAAQVSLELEKPFTLRVLLEV